ncbi:MAG: prolipoprotein diacylglyceryl transferase [Planctomycetaceae bacterium]
MRQVLFRIPLDSPWFFGVPGFGFGIVLGLWVVFGAWWLLRSRADWSGKLSRLILPGGIWVAVAVVVVLLPKLVHLSTDADLADAEVRLKNAEAGSAAYEQAHADRDRAWRRRRLFAAAVDEYKKERKQTPASVPVLRRLAWILATAPDDGVRDGKRAVALAQKAVGGSHRSSAAAWDVLAAARAETGDFTGAKEAAERAAEAAKREPKAPRGSAPVDSGEPGDVVGIRQRLNRYKNERPYRDLNAGRSLPVYGYGFMMFLGFVAAGWTAIRRGRLVGIEKDNIWDACLWVLVGGIGGARLWYTVQYRNDVFRGCEAVTDYLFALVNLQNGGLVLYGGIVGALTAFIVFCRRRKLDWKLMTDVIMPSFFLGLAFGRLGCLMNGCCYGDRSELPWAFSFPLGSVPDMVLVDRGFLDSAQAVTIALHPTQLYSALNALLLATLMHFYFFVRNRDGSVLAFSLLTYPVTRFLIEFLRGDEMGKFNTALTISQWGSLGVFAAGVLYSLWLSRRPRMLTPVRAEASAAGTPPNDEAS